MRWTLFFSSDGVQSYVLFFLQGRSFFVAAVLVLSHICIPSTYSFPGTQYAVGRMVEPFMTATSTTVPFINDLNVTPV